MHVVIIDDSGMNLTLFRHLVARLDDCVAQTFADPHEGLAHCLSVVPDLIIVDYMMPVLDGIELIRRFRAAPGRASIPVLMITANNEADVRYQALEAGANDFLSKPIDKTEFLARTRNMLALRISQKRLEDRASWLTEEVIKATEEVVSRERETILRLSRAAEYRDPETGAHILRMAQYSWLIAVRLGLPRQQQRLLLEAAPMHDIGKVGTPDNILLKPGKLDVAEFEIMKQHAAIGHQILAGSSSPLLQLAAEIAEEVKATSSEWGVSMNRVEIIDVQVLDQEFADSMRKQATAERDRRGTIIDAEADAQRVRMGAEADANAVRLDADARLYKAQKEAEAIRVTAEAQAWALATKGSSLETDGARFAQQGEIMRAQVDALKSLGSAENSKIVVIPTDLVQTVASLNSLLRK